MEWNRLYALYAAKHSTKALILDQASSRPHKWEAVYPKKCNVAFAAPYGREAVYIYRYMHCMQ